MPKPTYKLVQTLHMIESDGKNAVAVAEHEVIETGLTWEEAKKRKRGTDLIAVREIEAAPTTAQEVESAPLVGGYL